MANQNGRIRWSQRRVVGTKQAAWSDLTTYEVPFEIVGRDVLSEAGLRNLIANAVSRRLNRSGGIVGSSYGARSYTVESVDVGAGIARVVESVGIGD